MAMAGSPDAAHGGYTLDCLLKKGYRVLVNAGDDVHFGRPAVRFGVVDRAGRQAWSNPIWPDK